MLLKRKSPEAGGYAQQRYERGLRRWRSRIRLVLAAICGPFILAGFYVLIIDGSTLSWCAGALSGAFMAIWMAFREMPPAYIENWADGAEGERKTEKQLRPLQREGITLLHDVQARYGNYDHIAVGRSGVYLLDSKNLNGIVDVRAGTPYLRRRLDPDAETRMDRIRPRVLSAAAHLSEDISRHLGRRVWVQAVIVFWADFPEGLVEDHNCVYIDGSRLHGWLQNRPVKFEQADVEQIAGAVTDIAAGESQSDGTAASAGCTQADRSGALQA